MKMMKFGWSIYGTTLAYLKKRADDNWLIGYDSRQFTQLAEQLV